MQQPNKNNQRTYAIYFEYTYNSLSKEFFTITLPFSQFPRAVVFSDFFTMPLSLMGSFLLGLWDLLCRLLLFSVTATELVERLLKDALFFAAGFLFWALPFLATSGEVERWILSEFKDFGFKLPDSVVEEAWLSLSNDSRTWEQVSEASPCSSSSKTL